MEFHGEPTNSTSRRRRSAAAPMSVRAKHRRDQPRDPGWEGTALGQRYAFSQICQLEALALRPYPNQPSTKLSERLASEHELSRRLSPPVGSARPTALPRRPSGGKTKWNRCTARASFLGFSTSLRVHRMAPRLKHSDSSLRYSDNCFRRSASFHPSSAARMRELSSASPHPWPSASNAVLARRTKRSLKVIVMARWTLCRISSA